MYNSHVLSQILIWIMNNNLSQNNQSIGTVCVIFYSYLYGTVFLLEINCKRVYIFDSGTLYVKDGPSTPPHRQLSW